MPLDSGLTLCQQKQMQTTSLTVLHLIPTFLMVKPSEYTDMLSMVPLGLRLVVLQLQISSIMLRLLPRPMMDLRSLIRRGGIGLRAQRTNFHSTHITLMAPEQELLLA